jgi:hypothetical protein
MNFLLRLLLFFLVRPLKVLAKIVDLLFVEILISRTGSVYTWLFNLRSLINNRDIRLSYVSDLDVYQAVSDGRERFFFDERQNYYAYKRGFRKRAFLLAKQYHLDKLIFQPGDIVIDCGANVGDLELYFHFSGVKVRHIAFEPSPNEFAAVSYITRPCGTQILLLIFIYQREMQTPLLLSLQVIVP